MTYNLDVTFFIPCLNEEKNILNTLNNLFSLFQEIALTFEIILCDDNSKDATIEIVEKFIKNNNIDNIKIIKNSKTRGLGRNYIDCAFKANGKYYMLVNGDNAEPKETIKKILSKINRKDMIIPYFEKSDKRSFLRKITSNFFTFLVNLLSGYKIPYYNGPVLHKTYNVMRWSPDTHGYAYQAELITRILMEGGEYELVKIRNNPRIQGTSKAFSFQNILSVTHSLLQIFLRRLRNILFYN